MRTVTFKSVLHGVATRIGLDPVNNLQSNQARALAEYIDTELEIAWQMAPWPEWTRIELRRFRADWSPITAYVIGDEVYSSADAAYYRCLIGNTGQFPGTEGTIYWEATTALDRYIARDQPWQASTIGEVWGVFIDDPMTHVRPRKIGYWESPNGIQITGDVVVGDPTQVYVEFSLPPNHFCADEWDSGLNYLTGDCVYYPDTGECYEALADTLNVLPTETASWRKQDFPFVLAKYSRMKAVAEALREDENHNKAILMDQKADKELMDALDRIEKLRRTHEAFAVIA